MTIDDESDAGSWQRELDARPQTVGELRLELMDLRTQANRLARENEQLMLQLAKGAEATREANQRHADLARALRFCGIDAETVLRIGTLIEGVRPEEQR